MAGVFNEKSHYCKQQYPQLTPCTLHFVLYTLYLVLCTLYLVPCTLYFAPCTLYFVLRTLYFVPCTSYFTSHFAEDLAQFENEGLLLLLSHGAGELCTIELTHLVDLPSNFGTGGELAFTAENSAGNLNII